MSDTATLNRPPIEDAVYLPVTLIQPSPTNPRKHYDQAKLQELAESLRQHRQIQPILVRPRDDARKGEPLYEIVAGERRWRALGIAGIEQAMALVRAMSDFEVLELQMLENIQREDLTPLEEAEGYEALLRTSNKLRGYDSVAELAARIGKSERYVYNRLKLNALAPVAREALAAGKMSTSVALLVAHLPDAADQATATAKITAGFGGDAYSTSQAREYLRTTFMLRLDKATFPIYETFRVAGPCSECSKRSGAAPDLFTDTQSGDMCQDSSCYKAKAEEWHQQLLQDARDAGHKVLSGAEAKRIMPTYSGHPISGFHLADEPTPSLTDSKKSPRDLLGKKGAADLITLDLPGHVIVCVVADEALRKALKAKGLLRPSAEPKKPAAAAPAPSVSAPAPKAPPLPPPPVASPANGGRGDEDEEDSEQTDEAGAPGGAPAAARNVEALFRQALFARLHREVTGGEEFSTTALRTVVMKVMDVAISAEGMQAIYAARGWKAPASGVSFEEDLQRRLEDASPRVLAELLLEASYVEELTYPVDPGWHMSPLPASSPALAIATEYGIDLVDMRARIERGELPTDDNGEASWDATAAFVAAHAPTKQGAAR